MPTRIIRVVPAVQGWALEIEGLAEKPLLYTSLEAAITAGWHRAKHDNAELHIHRQDGTVRLLTALAADSGGDKE
ncbi:DUF2188 domain-containing protein [Cupriavidus sp. L7L]|uniref:DUF2188 domain-containing protein n=1 Tax=Cupriavidus sp. L7L TaxID=2546443 RepID=UPI001055FAA6|nr:DUF2188 domain-containing protein [Cupriavidus sp. L7L]TDF65605.1 DUF2188 domain-containing protein [Cupriavidus sp. L7L]